MVGARHSSSAFRTFSQRHGYQPLPEPMRLGELSNHLRRELCNALRSFFLSISDEYGSHRFFTDDAEKYIERVLGQFLELPERQISTSFDDTVKATEEIIINSDFNEVLDLIEIILYENSLDPSLGERISELFETHTSAYWLDTSKTTYQFIPRGSIEQGEATKMAIEALESEEMVGATEHLRRASELINAKQYGDSVAQSILAVESVARLIDPEANRTLGPALSALERRGMIKHRALKNAFQSLYGYTNDENGIRHALLEDDESKVGLEEAMLMFGSCASFATYLVEMHRRSKST